MLSDDGRVAPAEVAYRRSVEIREALWRDNPTHIEITAGYAGSLCSVGRWDDAEQRVDEVLARVPRHPYANQLKRHIAAHRWPGQVSSAPPASRTSSPTPPINKPWWKRWMQKKKKGT